MHKKSELTAFGFITTAIITLIVVGVAIKITVDLTGKPVQYLLGFGDITAFDKDIVERYNATQLINKDAISSVDALLYSINRLAVYNINDDYNKFRKEFGSVIAEPTKFGERQIHFTGYKADVLKQLSKEIVNCHAIFQDIGEQNTACFTADFILTAIIGSINEDDIINALNNYKDSPECDGKCKKRVKDLTGEGWFNRKNLVLDNIEISNGQKDIRICSEKGTFKNRIYITKDKNKCKEKEKAKELGFVVENFNLPQEIAKSSNPITYTVEEWLAVFGDPGYILYYEKFPQEEAEYWKAGSFRTAFLTILGTQAVFLGLDIMTMGAGKVLSPVLKKTIIGKGVNAIRSAVKALGKGAAEIIGRGLKRIFGKPVQSLVRKEIERTVIEQSTYQIATNGIKEVLGETATEIEGTSFVRSVSEVVSDITTNSRFVKEGALNSEGKKELFRRLEDEVFKETNPAYKEIIEKRAYQLSEELKRTGNFISDEDTLIKAAGEVRAKIGLKAQRQITEALEEASQRKITKAMIYTYRKANRVWNMFQTALSGDMTDEAREKVIRGILEDSNEFLKQMKPSELRTFMANQQDAVDMIFDKYTGQVLFGEVIEAGEDVVAQKIARQELAKRLDDIILKEGAENFGKNFPMSVAIQKYAAGPLGSRIRSAVPGALEQPFHLFRARHLVAASAAYLAAKIESMAAKNYPVGTNAIGLRIPYEATVVYDELEHIPNTIYFFEHYGELGYQGMLPEVNQYYLSLTKDQFKDKLWNQKPQRFHLVSPCYADIIMKVTNCECYYHDDPESGIYETGKPYPQLQEAYPDKYPNGIQPNFDGENPMLFRLDENGNPIKECIPKGVFQRDPTLYKPKCIKINPVLKETESYNYCYHGINPIEEAWKTRITILEYGLPILGGFCGLPASPACIAGIYSLTFVAGETIKEAIDTTSQWPKHK